jgi:uncharacterized damage-inducible protein DinB
VESSWIRALAGQPDWEPKFEDYQTLERVRNLSANMRVEVEEFLCKWSDDMERKTITVSWRPGEVFTYGEVLCHVIAHEIHHIGQLSVWARELGRQPVSASLLGRHLV